MTRPRRGSLEALQRLVDKTPETKPRHATRPALLRLAGLEEEELFELLDRPTPSGLRPWTSSALQEILSPPERRKEASTPVSDSTISLSKEDERVLDRVEKLLLRQPTKRRAEIIITARWLLERSDPDRWKCFTTTLRGLRQAKEIKSVVSVRIEQVRGSVAETFVF